MGNAIEVINPVAKPEEKKSLGELAKEAIAEKKVVKVIPPKVAPMQNAPAAEPKKRGRPRKNSEAVASSTKAVKPARKYTKAADLASFISKKKFTPSDVECIVKAIELVGEK